MSLIVHHNEIGDIELYPAPIHQGKMFSVYFSKCDRFAVKIPNESDYIPSKDYNRLFEYKIITGSEPIYRGMEPCKLDSKILNELLLRQSQFLAIKKDTFRVKIFGMGALEKNDREALIMQKYKAKELSSFDLQEYYQSFPGIFYALKEYRHGDISPDNILLDTDDIYLHIIYLAVHYIRYYDKQVVDRRVSSIIVTNAFYYPIIEPKSVLDETKVTALGNSISQRKLSLVYSMCMEDYRDIDYRPDYADVMALGIMFYHKVTAHHPFPNMINYPIWNYKIEYAGGARRKLTIPSIGFEKFFNLDLDFNEMRDLIYEKTSFLLNTLNEPINLNRQISNLENEFVMSLLRYDKPFDWYIDVSEQIVKQYSNKN